MLYLCLPFYSCLLCLSILSLGNYFLSYISFKSSIDSFKMSLHPWQQAQEAAYFNWKCLICSEIAQPPAALEDQHFVEYGPFTDINGDKWVKCDKCFNSYHVQCLKEDIPVGKYTCTFLGCWK